MNIKIGESILWILGIGFTFAVFTFSIWIAFINRGSQQSLQLIQPILGGVALAIFIGLGIISVPIDKFSEKTNVLMLSKENGQIIDLDQLTLRKFQIDMNSGYTQMGLSTIAYWPTHLTNEKISDLKTYLLDLTEWTTFTWISRMYPNHWQVERENFYAISAGAGFIAPQEDAEKKIAKYDMAQELAGNRFADFYRGRKDSYSILNLPNQTKVTYKRINDKKHEVILENNFINAKISFAVGSGGWIATSDLAEELKKKFGPAWNEQIRVIFTVTPNRFRQWSPETERQLKWFKELSSFYKEKFDWENFRPKLEQSLNIEGYWTKKD